MAGDDGGGWFVDLWCSVGPCGQVLVACLVDASGTVWCGVSSPGLLGLSQVRLCVDDLSSLYWQQHLQ